MASASVADLVFDALANQARRDIVVRLSRGGATTPDLGRDFPMTKQALSRHVRLLEDSGLIERHLRGRAHELRLVPDHLDGLSRWTTTIRENWSVNLDRLDYVLRDRDG